MLASVPSSETWAWQVQPELREAAATRAGSWKLTTWEHEPREGWIWDDDRLVCVEIVLTEQELNALNATARQNIASGAKEQVLRGSMEQTAARLWRTGSLIDMALRILAPEMVVRWIRGGQVRHPTWFTLCCGYERGRFRTECTWIGAPSETKRRHFSLRHLFWGGSGGGDEPDDDGDGDDDPSSSSSTSGTGGEGGNADPTVSENAEGRIRWPEVSDLAVRSEEQEALVCAQPHGRYMKVLVPYPASWGLADARRLLRTVAPVGLSPESTTDDKPEEFVSTRVVPMLAVLGQDHDKDKPKDRAPIVGVLVAPCSELPNVYTNSLANVERAIEKRLTEKARPCTWTKSDKRKIGDFVRAAMSHKGIFSEERVRSWFEAHFDLVEMRSNKWGEKRFTSVFEALLTQVDPEFRFKTAVKPEHMPEGKAPRFLIIDGDHGQVLALASVKCMEEVLFEVMESHSIKHASKNDAMERVLKHMVPPREASRLGSTFVEGDGSAWDTTCNTEVRGCIENPVLDHISRVLATTYIQPASWAEAHNKANNAKTLKLFFKKYHEQAHVQIAAIRRSGHRGTSVLNWWVNYTMWVCSLFESPQVYLRPEARWAKDVAGVRRWFYGVFEGDDSGISTSPKLCDVSADDVKAFRDGKVNARELGDKYCVPDGSIAASISALAFWDRAGFNMKWEFAKKRGTIVGCHIGLTETDPGSKTGCVVPTGVFCPELPRALKGAVSCSPAIIQALKNCASVEDPSQGSNLKDFRDLMQIVCAFALSRAADFAGKIPTVSKKYLEYANRVPYVKEEHDFEDREMSIRATGAEGASSTDVRDMIMARNGAVTVADEQAFLEALDYTATDKEIQFFNETMWDIHCLDRHDDFGRSIPTRWRVGGSI
jgi:hypothetical protein